MDRLNVGVVGGSLGGLTAACLLHDLGHEVTVFERSPRELEERGAGIGYLKATGRYLEQRAGVAAEAITVATPYVRYLDRSGGVAHQSAHPYLFSSWNAVYRSTLASFPTDRYLLDHELVDFETGQDRAVARFGNGTEFEGDLLVCADGIGSIVRARLQPDAVRRYAGYVAWRGVVSESVLGPDLTEQFGDAITYFVYENSHILIYPIPSVSGAVAPGERLVNFVWYRNHEDGDALADVLTDRHGVRRDLSVPPGAMAPDHDAEARAHAAAVLPPQINELITATTDLFVQVVYDVEVDRMVFERTVLLGDAAFAVRPHAAAGTAKAADDGWTLAESLAAHGTVDAALSAWEPPRLALGRDLLERTRRIGWRSQVENSWTPGDTEFIFGLYKPGD
ncbi:MAG: FAD-dependent monooxygenase [Actinomycetota bacterium]